MIQASTDLEGRALEAVRWCPLPVSGLRESQWPGPAKRPPAGRVIVATGRSQKTRAFLHIFNPARRSLQECSVITKLNDLHLC
jgi:hypothetical protein